ncbi:DNA-binding response regulator [Flavobacterium noncentrifugens]|uniref:Two component transcriptional regulator, LytTR family n=1 Tax=Flavobacterium noncentrifugens TaxID=1128970 RepID=A0A1G8Y8P2_9FLAO|nr:response regulator transcription factor [Flavobacterium noncentrifugens]GEP51127.1 DNA-binding response regulator [Flavobacterium noncentrifugens]SDJ99081.1 two component transcriptional regulator, LytTR family [Flavobacterium noncentrifugens]
MGITYRCLIVDDETPAHKALASHISKFDDLEHSGSAYSGKEALKMLNENQYDLIFLDINMPVLSGIELMELQPVRPLTIVTTAYSDFALEAYQNDAIDYLLKPISLEKFAKAIEKARTFFAGTAQAKVSETKSDKMLSVKVNGGMMHIALDTLMYIESTGNYLKLFCTKNKLPFIVYGTLLGMAEAIGNADFIQIHRSFIVNTSFVNNIGQTHLTLYNGIEIPVGRKYKILLSR